MIEGVQGQSAPLGPWPCLRSGRRITKLMLAGATLPAQQLKAAHLRLLLKPYTAGPACPPATALASAGGGVWGQRSVLRRAPQTKAQHCAAQCGTPNDRNGQRRGKTEQQEGVPWYAHAHMHTHTHTKKTHMHTRTHTHTCTHTRTHLAQLAAGHVGPKALEPAAHAHQAAPAAAAALRGARPLLRVQHRVAQTLLLLQHLLQLAQLLLLQAGRAELRGWATHENERGRGARGGERHAITPQRCCQASSGVGGRLLAADGGLLRGGPAGWAHM